MGEFHQMLSYTFRNNFFATFIKSTKKVACNFHKSNEEICCSQNQGALKQSFGWTSMKKCLQRIITTFYFEVWTLSKTLPLWSIDDSGWTSLRCQWRSTSLDPSIHSHGVALREHFTKPPNLKKKWRSYPIFRHSLWCRCRKWTTGGPYRRVSGIWV